ncbi:MAG: histidine kinase [Caulobacterales bacterium RIFCSPHIGHO2_01_FULL_70_19]|nr:MAG: histidine kinase [Caulobacterales bacterium RIFCSPHIGHO2_01_FULL_70_19]
MSGFFYVLEDDARLLFVDDDPILREFAQVNLASPSTHVDLAAGGEDGLRLMARQSYDLVLLDLEMPGMDGFAVLERMREDAALRHVPVVVQTGREDVEAIDRCFHLGAASFVMKPLNWRLLTYQIRYVLRAERRAKTERVVAAA